MKPHGAPAARLKSLVSDMPAQRRVRRAALALVLACTTAGTAVQAQSPSDPIYPRRPIRMIVASSAGTASDYFARVLSERMSETYKQQVIVDNRTGAGGLIGNHLISRGNPDGHTLGIVSGTRLISELIRDQSPYRALDDIVAVAHVASITNVIATSPSVPVRNLNELIRFVRGRPGDLNYASAGIGSSSHLAAEMFTRAAGLDVVHVPFRTITDAFVEMVIGRVHYSVFTVTAVLPVLREGKLRAIAVTTTRRSPVLPEIPTVIEAGLPEARFENWSGIVAPTGTPRRIVEQLHGDFVAWLRTPAMRDQFAKLGAVPVTDSTPESFMRLMEVDYQRYQQLVRRANIRVE
jgi:tripartite-type tricarboxylate transporter receptor subunit TctC